MPVIFNKERLIKGLILVSIFSIVMVGLYYMNALWPNAFYAFSVAAKSVIMPFSFAFLLSFIIAPFARFIESKTFLNKTLSIIAAISIGIMFLVLILTVTIAFLISQAVIITTRFIDTIDSALVQDIIDTIVVTIENSIYAESFDEAIEQFEEFGFSLEVVFGWVQSFGSNFFKITSRIIHAGFTIILTPVFMFYLIKDREKVFNGILFLFPNHVQNHLKPLAQESDKVIRGYFIGHGQVMIFITLFFMITYSILAIFIPGFNIWYALLFALVMGLFSIIPYLGVWISMSMPIVLFLTLHFESSDSGYIYIIGVIMIFVLNIIEEVLESTIVQPNIFSKQVKIHPVAVLSSFLFFGSIFGLAGFVLAVPIAGTIKVTIRYFRSLKSAQEATT